MVTLEEESGEAGIVQQSITGQVKNQNGGLVDHKCQQD